MLVYRLFVFFLFINKCLPDNKLEQITPKLTHPVVLQLSICLFCNGFLAGTPGTLMNEWTFFVADWDG